VAALLCAAVFVAGCGGDGEANAVSDEDPGGTASTDDQAGDDGTEELSMPDVVGMPVDDAVAELEELGLQVSTGVVRTTEMEPELVYRSEPAPGRRLQEGQRVILRIAGEPRQ
jgi:beta-lactam-binding protein with PASTA domain